MLTLGSGGVESPGKSRSLLAQVKQRLLLEDKVCILAQSGFYKDGAEHPQVNHPDYNFDHPDAFECPGACARAF